VAEEEVLGADVVVAELPGFLDRELEDALGLRRKGHFTERERLGETGQGPLDFRLHRLEPEAQTLEDSGRDPFAVANQPEEDVLSAHEVVSETTGFLPRQDDDPSRPLGESFKHWRAPPLPEPPERNFLSATAS